VREKSKLKAGDGGERGGQSEIGRKWEGGRVLVIGEKR